MILHHLLSEFFHVVVLGSLLAKLRQADLALITGRKPTPDHPIGIPLPFLMAETWLLESGLAAELSAGLAGLPCLIANLTRLSAGLVAELPAGRLVLLSHSHGRNADQG
jgi:hypothetical protein